MKNFEKVGFSISLQFLLLLTLLIFLDYFMILEADFYMNLRIISCFVIIVFSYFFYKKYSKKDVFSKVCLLVFYLGIFVLLVDSIFQIVFVGDYDYVLYITLIVVFVLLNVDGKKILKFDFKYKKEIVYVLLVLILLFSFYLRINNLDVVDPYTDEYYHLAAAKNYVNYGDFEYQRGQLVTYMTIFFQKFADDDLKSLVFWGRVPGVLFGVLTTFMIFVLARRISDGVGLFSSFLWAISPWAIGVSKTVREYAFYPFFVLLGIYLLLKFSDRVNKIEHLFEKKNILFLFLVGFYMVFFTIYSIFIDYDATLKLGVLVFALVFVYIFFSKFSFLKKFYLDHEKVLAPVLVLVLSLVGVLGYYAVTINEQTSFDKMEFDEKWSVIFFDAHRSHNPANWWNEISATSNFVYFVFFFGVFGAIALRRFEILSYFIVFLGLILFYSFFFDRYFKPRYIFYLLSIFVIILGSGLYNLFEMSLRFKSNVLKIGGVLLVLLFLANVYSYSNLKYTQVDVPLNQVLNSTGEYHDEMYETLANFSYLFDETSVVLSGTPQIVNFVFDVDRNNIFYYDYRNETRLEDAKKIMAEHPKGYIVTDERRNKIFSKGFEEKNYTLEIDRMNFVNLTLIYNSHWKIYSWQVEKKGFS